MTLLIHSDLYHVPHRHSMTFLTTGSVTHVGVTEPLLWYPVAHVAKEFRLAMYPREGRHYDKKILGSNFTLLQGKATSLFCFFLLS